MADAGRHSKRAYVTSTGSGLSKAAIRICTVYASDLVAPTDMTGDEPTCHFELGRLARYYDRSSAQLPKVVDRRSLPLERIHLNRWTRPDRLRAADAWSFVLPTGQLVLALTMDVDCEIVETVDLLWDCYDEDVVLDEMPLASMLLPDDLRTDTPCELLPERHQLVFASIESPYIDVKRLFRKSGLNEDDLQRVIYRTDLPYRPEYSSIVYPAELNRRPTSAAGMGPYISAFAGQQDYVESAAFLSAVQAVGSAARLREIRADVYDSIRELDIAPEAPRSLVERRQRLEALADKLSRMEVDLSRGVEAPAALGLLVPSLRVESFHATLFDCMSLTEQATTVARMISRVERAIAADLTSIESAERRADDRRRLRWTVAVGFISTVAVPVTLVLGFFGVNAKEVDVNASIFDARYVPVYLLSASFVVIAVALFAGMYLQQWINDRTRHDRRPNP